MKEYNVGFKNRNHSHVYFLKTHQIHRNLVLWVFAMILAGCAMSPFTASVETEAQSVAGDAQTSVHGMGVSGEELAAELTALRESHQKLERLSELEGDLMLLLEELARQPKIDERPNGYRPEVSTETVEPDESFTPSQNNQPLVIAKKSPSTHSNDNTRIARENNNESIASDALGHPVDDNAKPTTTPGSQRPFNYDSSNYMLWLGFFVSEKAAHAGSRRLQNKINFQRMGLSVEVVNNANIRGHYYGLILGPFQTQRQANAFCSALSRHGQYCLVRSNPQSRG